MANRRVAQTIAGRAAAKKTTSSSSSSNSRPQSRSARTGIPREVAAAAKNPVVVAGGTAPKFVGTTGQRAVTSDPMRNTTTTTGYTPLGTNFDKGESVEAQQFLELMGQKYNEAKAIGDVAAMNRAHNMAEQYRIEQLGYFGGVDGSQRINTIQGGTDAGSVEQGAVTIQRSPEARAEMQNFTSSGAKPTLATIADLSKNYLGDISFDEDEILGKFQDATKAEFAGKGEALRGVESQFSGNLFNTQLSAQDAIRRANAGAVATGASRGVQAAQELSSILGLEQESTQGATELAQARSLLGLQENEALSKDVVEALTTANAAKTGVGGLAGNLYAADTQFGVGEMDYYANLENSIKNLEGILSTAEGNVDVANINKEGQVYAADKSYDSYLDKTNLDNASRERIAAAENLSRQEVANIQAKVYNGNASTAEASTFQSLIQGYMLDGSPAAEASFKATMKGHNLSDEQVQELWDKGQLGVSIKPKTDSNTKKKPIVKDVKDFDPGQWFDWLTLGDVNEDGTTTGGILGARTTPVTGEVGTSGNLSGQSNSLYDLP